MKEEDDYFAYLIRFWREDGRSAWHASLQNPQTGQRHHFATPESMWQFLQSQLDSVTPNSQPPSATDSQLFL